jgi:hypothetical protein
MSADRLINFGVSYILFSVWAGSYKFSCGSYLQLFSGRVIHCFISGSGGQYSSGLNILTWAVNKNQHQQPGGRNAISRTSPNLNVSGHCKDPAIQKNVVFLQIK